MLDFPEKKVNKMFINPKQLYDAKNFSKKSERNEGKSYMHLNNRKKSWNKFTLIRNSRVLPGSKPWKAISVWGIIHTHAIHLLTVSYNCWIEVKKCSSCWNYSQNYFFVCFLTKPKSVLLKKNHVRLNWLNCSQSVTDSIYFEFMSLCLFIFFE